MVRFLVRHPVAVCMAFVAFFLLGIITYINIPVSLLPDIAIPEITIQISGDNTSARELENTVVLPVRQQLLQVGKLRDIRSETRDGSAIIKLNFEFGVDTDLAFIEINEKVDEALNYIPKEVDRPRVVKASATDIPVFYLYLTLKNPTAFGESEEEDFLELCQFAEAVIHRRIEQLPQVAMVDMSGIVNKQVLITPNASYLEIVGITLGELEEVLQNNNIEPGSMVIRDGYYEYNVKFSSVLRTIEDIQNIYIKKNDKIFQLKDFAEVALVSEKEKGLVLYNGKRAISMAVIKQADENMSNMQASLNSTISDFEELYPHIDFNISQNQTELLDYTISNLQQNLILAFLFICIVSALFLKDVRSPLIIGLSMFVSLIISLLFFYLFNVSLNVISLTGLILALGMMIDNSIIVTDNIGQYQQRGLNFEDSCVKGTSEVIAPMLSSSLTTIAVFVPLIFLSGIAGAIFFDQAFSVTIGLLVSYLTGIILLPVLYKLVFSFKRKSSKKRDATENNIQNKEKKQEQKESFLEKCYHAGVKWVFSHKIIVLVVMLSVFPLCVLLFNNIPKERMPEISQNELIVNVEWNENIHVEENKERVLSLFKAIEKNVIEYSALVAQQQYLLNRERELTSSEAEVYFKTPHVNGIAGLKDDIAIFFNTHYPHAVVSFTPPSTIFEKIFDIGEAKLTVEYYTRNTSQEQNSMNIRTIETQLTHLAGTTPSGISFQKQLNIQVDRDKLLLYNVSYDEIHNTLKTAFRENQVTEMRSFHRYLPVLIGSEDLSILEILENTLVYTEENDKGEKNRLPLSSFVTVTAAEDLKTIIAGRNGEYIPFNFFDIDNVESVVSDVRDNAASNSSWEVDFSGSFFSNKKMIQELMVILFISILLMYFILAAQFESFVQPLIVLLEIPIDITAAIGLLMIMGHSLNLMSAIGIIVTCGIIINDSILKIDVINQLREEGVELMDAIHEGGRRRLKAIIMTSLTTIVCMAPLLFSSDMGSELEKPLAIATIGGMVIGTIISLFVVPLAYWCIYRKKANI
ncbi:MAG: efflux RND transporter permease subunit [Prevotellaceae bacterium]|jgi:multidrug efflux pump subunit AcrB|nr:efflux RND transporter permease subunit [Prevotellaceae bacterium]